MTSAAASTGCSLIEAGAAYGPAIAELHKRCFDEPWSAFTVRQVLAMSGAFGLLAVGRRNAPGSRRTDPDLMGFALCRSASDECELLSLAVAAWARNRGIGTVLLEGAMDRARERGAARMFLEGAEDNVIAQGLYRSHGFAPVGRRPNYYRRVRGPAMAALTLSVSLAPAGGG